MFYLRNHIYVLSIFLLPACYNPNKKIKSQSFIKDSALVSKLINLGDSIYSQKTDYSTFSKSSGLYDSAWQIAKQTNDTNLIATAIFAKGRAYDAINNNPQKTIDYYTEAALLFGTLPHNKIKALYINHLVAHSYDKVQDSIHCIAMLKKLYSDIIMEPDSIKEKMHFIAEMALISTEVKNYTLAEDILKNLTKREWIENDKIEYDYLNHYYLTKARLAVFYEGNAATQYVDSLENIFKHSKNLGDSMYYSSQLWSVYKAIKNYDKENYYLELNNAIFSRFNSPEKVRETQNRLAKMEVASIEMQRKMEQDKSAIKTKSMYVMAFLLSIISLLALFLKNRNKEIKRKRNEVLVTNHQLEQKNIQNELLNKEIHHRVKNNLQMIMSLVNLQENNTNTEEVKENMQAISLRIEGIANLHQQLMEQADVVDLKKYVQNLVNNLANILGDGKKVITHLHIEPIILSAKISFPLGLIINEWITNSVKYAKPLKDDLEISIEITANAQNVKVSYADNGIPQVTKPHKKTLGLDIINILVNQLDGTIKNNIENIFTYYLIIPLNDGE